MADAEFLSELQEHMNELLRQRQLDNSIVVYCDQHLGVQMRLRRSFVIGEHGALRASADINSLTVWSCPNFAALAFIMANRDSVESAVPTYTTKSDLERAGYNSTAAGVALTSLIRKQYYTPIRQDEGGEPFSAYCLTDSGEDWVLETKTSSNYALKR